MESDLLESTLFRSYKALQTISEDTIEKLPLVDCVLIVSVLSDTPALAGVRLRLTDHLQKQLSTSWIEKGDLYEVFAVLNALWQYNPTLITGEHLTSMVQRLITSEVSVGGPYFSNGAIAITANSQIAIFMRLVAKPLPKVDAFLADVITAGRFDDTELTSFGLLYMLATARGSQKLTQYVAQRWRQAQWQTPLRQAIALTILKDKVPSAETKTALTALCKKQHSDGFWDGESLVKKRDAKLRSRFTTTALITSVLINYQQAQVKAPFLDLQRKHRIIARSARQAFSAYAEPLRSSALAVVNQVCQADKNFEITLLPYFFARAMKTPPPLTHQQFTTLGLASIYGWMAYTIYDSFLDGEGRPAQLPVANIAMRASQSCFREALPDQDLFQHYVSNVFSAMDEANAWEVSHCRFTVQAGKVGIGRLPRYGNRAMLASRSFAHALTPMAVLAKHFVSPGSAQARLIESAFRHYLIARQLNDDMYDWLEDMQSGQATYVATAILRDMRVKPGAYHLRSLLPAMQKHFRHTTMPQICQRILWHIDMSRHKFVKSKLLRTKNDIYVLLDNLELSVRNSLDTQSKAHTFGTSRFKK